MTGAGVVFQVIAVPMWLIFHIVWLRSVDKTIDGWGRMYGVKRHYYEFNKAYRWRLMLGIMGTLYDRRRVIS